MFGDFKKYRIQRSNADNFEYIANNTRSINIPNENAIDRLALRLKFDWTSSGGALYSGAGLNLIDRLEVRVGGSKVVYNVPGKLLQVLTHIYHGKPYTKHPGTSGSGTAEYNFVVPFNAATAQGDGAGFVSLLDATKSTVKAHATFKDKSVIWSAGTNTISNIELTCDVISSYHPDAGVIGSVGYDKNSLHLMTTDQNPVLQSRTDWPFDLTAAHVHKRAIILTETDGMLTDDILNKVIVKASENNMQPIKREDIQVENMMRYGFDAPLTGIYIVDHMDKGMWPQMMSMDSNQRFRYELDVNKPGSGTEHTMHILHDKFIVPKVNKAA